MQFSASESDDSAHPLTDEDVPAWQARALARSMADARARSVDRMARFVAAARELATESASSAFTVQQVVARSGQSLKSFYRLFAGKDELLLALLAEDCALGATVLEDLVAACDDPRDRVEAWVRGLFELMAAGDQGYVAVLVREHGHLAEERPAELAEAVEPFIGMLERELATAGAAGALRPIDDRRDALLVFELVLAGIRELVVGRDERTPAEVAGHVWAFCAGGLLGGMQDDDKRSSGRSRA